jgi:N-acetylglucosamine-6-sulfatase
MNRRWVVACSTAAVVVAAMAIGIADRDRTAAGRAAAGTRPNVVVIESDDQTVEQMKVMKNVNRLIGDQGATFANSFVNFSLCCPSRTTFLTGQYMHNHGVVSNHRPNGGFERFEALHAHNNLATWLKRAGYTTALIGKYLNEYRDQWPTVPGWSEWHATPEGYGAYDYPINNGGTLTQYGDRPSDLKDDVLTRKAVNFVDRRAPEPKPFFLWLTYTAPHWAPPDPNPNPPHNCRHAAKPAPRFAHAFDSAPLPRRANFNEADVSDKPQAIRYLGYLGADRIDEIQRKYRCALESLLSVDQGVKRLIAALRSSGELNDTLLIYTSDNGYFNGEHRIFDDKQHLYEESIRVPLEIRGPGVPAGVKVYPSVINADLAPTIVDAANVKAGLTMDGRSLLPVVSDPGIDRNRELLIEEPSFRAIRTKRYLYARHRTGEEELYDLKLDRFELRSVQADPAYAAVKAALAKRLRRLQDCAGASCRVYQSDPPGP